MAIVCIADCIVRTLRQAVEANDTPRRVNDMTRQVDTRRLASMLTPTALYALIRINIYPKHRIARNDTERSPYGAYRVAERATVAKSQHSDYEHRQSGNHRAEQ